MNLQKKQAEKNYTASYGKNFGYVAHWTILFVKSRSLQGNLRPRSWCKAEVCWDFLVKIKRTGSISYLRLRSIKTKNWSADNFKKHVKAMSYTPEPAIQSGYTGQQIPFWQLTITWMSIRMSNIKLNTGCIWLGHQASNARSLQENSQSEHVHYCGHIIKSHHCEHEHTADQIWESWVNNLLNRYTSASLYWKIVTTKTIT